MKSISGIMKKYFYSVLPVILIVGALISGVFIYRAGIKQEMVKESPLPSLRRDTPGSTPLPELKRKDLKLQVLNGRGTPNTAGEAKKYLESLGYKSIEVGNADAYNYEKTEISIKKDKKNYFDLLKEDLSKKYATSGKMEILDAESDLDAVAIIGK